MNRLACQYAIVRFLPYAETGEFANVGVVLACPAVGYLGARLMATKRTGRIGAFFDQLDKRIYREALGYFDDELNRVRAMVHAKPEGDRERIVLQMFAGLTRPRESLLRFSDTRAVLADDTVEMLDKLFARFVERDFADKSYHDKILERGVRQILSRAHVREYFKPDVIGNDDLHVQVPFVHRQDDHVTLAIKPLDLAKDDPNQVFDRGGHWVDRVRRLDKHDLLPEEMLFAVKAPDPANTRARLAVDEIIEDLRLAGVQVAAADDADAITRFAKRVVGH